MMSSVFRFYRDGFRQMTLGRTLWVLILIKLFVIFVIMRLLFFQPAMKGLSNDEKQQRVATEIGALQGFSNRFSPSIHPEQ
ncbi:MAG: DUF4492 domain-containing protein [Bacteroidaceae bacterium]|nr:DUF4492 domain-containing protein [Bacteroidaceae bacterium]